jgi:hypothetical protein
VWQVRKLVVIYYTRIIWSCSLLFTVTVFINFSSSFKTCFGRQRKISVGSLSTLTSVRPESLDAFGVVRSAELSWHSSCHILQNQNHQIKCLNIADIFFAFLFLKLHRAPTKAFCTGLFLILRSASISSLKNVVVFNSYPNGNVIFYVLFFWKYQIQRHTSY